LFSGQDIENATYFSLEASNRSVASWLNAWTPRWMLALCVQYSTILLLTCKDFYVKSLHCQKYTNGRPFTSRLWNRLLFFFDI
jgi:hypothetical protein